MKGVIVTRLWTFLNSVGTSRWLATSSLILLFHAPGIPAWQATFAWNANSEPIIGGYRLYSGPASRNYKSFVDVGNQTTYTVYGLADNATYYFAVTAYDTTKKLESAFSNEIVSVPTPALTVTKTGNGVGTVTSTPAGITCGTDCAQSYARSTVVTLTATPATGSTFTGWGGACSGTGACRVTMTVARTVTTTFARPVLTVGKTGSGAGRVTSAPTGINCGPTCAAAYNRNTAVTLTAAAHAGSTFAGWSGACSGTAATCPVTLEAAKTVAARFNTTTAGQTALALYKNGVGLGTVTSNPAGINCGTTCTTGVFNFATGATVALTAAAATGSTFTGWSGACTGTGPCRLTLSTTGRVVTASFTRPVLTVRKTGSGLVTSTPAGINCGPVCAAPYNLTNPPLTVTLTATPDTGYRFGSWSGCTPPSGAPLQCTVPMNQSRTATANFIR